MQGFLTELFYMSLTASYLVVVVLLLRLLLAKAPKWIRVIWWGIVGIRLLVPLQIESIFSLIPRAMTPKNIPDASMAAEAGLQTPGVIDPVFSQINIQAGASALEEGVMQQASNGISWDFICFAIWTAGVLLMLAYCIASYVRLSFRMREAIKYDGKGPLIYQSEKAVSPFVLGVLKPRIYLPYALEEEDRECVIAHETAHIARKDHLTKLIAFVLLAVHWFNPFIWIAYIFLCRDIEFACDEKVIGLIGEERKKLYSQALLKCSVSKHSIAACPVAFGETGVKGRIKNVLNYRKPTFWIVLVSLLLCLAVAVCFLTNPRGKVTEKPEEIVKQTEIMEEKPEKPEEVVQPEEIQEEKEKKGPPHLLLQDASASDVSFFEVESDTYKWSVMEAKPGTKSWEAFDGNNTVMVSSESEGLHPTSAVKGKEQIILSDGGGVSYVAYYGEALAVNDMMGYTGEVPDKITIREYDLLDLGDASAEPISEKEGDAAALLTLYPRRIYEIVAEWNLGQYQNRGFYGSATYCFATSEQVGESTEAAFNPEESDKVDYEVNLLPEVSLSMDEYKSWEGEVLLSNNSEDLYNYGEWFEIQYCFGDAWYRVPCQNMFGYHDIAWLLPAGDSAAVNINWKDVYGELSAGTYRIVKSVSGHTPEGEAALYYLADEFEIL